MWAKGSPRSIDVRLNIFVLVIWYTMPPLLVFQRFVDCKWRDLDLDWNCLSLFSHRWGKLNTAFSSTVNREQEVTKTFRWEVGKDLKLDIGTRILLVKEESYGQYSQRAPCLQFPDCSYVSQRLTCWKLCAFPFVQKVLGFCFAKNVSEMRTMCRMYSSMFWYKKQVPLFLWKLT